MQELTLFSLNIDDYITVADKKLHELCFNSWKIAVEYFESLGYKVYTKIYTKQDADYIEFYKDFTTRTQYTINNLKISHLADAFRLYIMSNKPNYLWFDWDILFMPNFKLLNFDYNKKIFKKSFGVLYNANDLDFFKKIYNHILDNRLSNNEDKKLVDKLLASKIIDSKDLSSRVLNNALNLFWLKNERLNYLIFINKVDYNNSHYIEMLNWINNGSIGRKPNKYVFISLNIEDVVVKNLHNNLILVKFILDNYNLSEEQTIMLSSWLK